MESKLSGTHQKVYERVFQHPMPHNLQDLKKHYPDVAERVVGSVAVGEHHLTEDQLLAKARDFYAEAAKSENDVENNREQKSKTSNETKSKE